jgi:hypothetical protein
VKKEEISEFYGNLIKTQNILSISETAINP